MYLNFQYIHLSGRDSKYDYRNGVKFFRISLDIYLIVFNQKILQGNVFFISRIHIDLTRSLKYSLFFNGLINKNCFQRLVFLDSIKSRKARRNPY